MLHLPLDTVAWIIVKARALDASESGLEAGFEDPEDAAEDELGTWIADLTDTQRAELVALFWLGRDGGDADEFPGLVAQARAHLDRPTAAYLLGSPMLADWLEEGLEALGFDVADVESLAS